MTKMPEVRWCYDSSGQVFEYCDPQEVRAAFDTLPALLAVVEAAMAYSSQAPDIDMRDARDQLHRALSRLNATDEGKTR